MLQDEELRQKERQYWASKGMYTEPGMLGSETPLCLVCYRPMGAVDYRDVPTNAVRELACALPQNCGIIEDYGWIWCPDSKYYSHLPTIERLLEDHRRMAKRRKRKNQEADDK